VIVLLLLALAVAQDGARSAAREAPQPQRAGGTIRGRITDRDTGQPLPRFRVSISRQPLRSDNVRPIDTAVTDATGAYELTNVPAGLYLVTARPPEYVATHLAQVHGYDEPGLPVPMSLRANTNVRPGAVIDINLALQRGVAIEGTVTTEDGDPVANAVVTIEGLDRRATPAPVVTDDFGRYRHFGLAPGRYRLCATPGPMTGLGASIFNDVLVKGCHGAFEVKDGDLRDAHLTLGRINRFSVSGEVFDSYGAPFDRGEIAFVEAPGTARRSLKVVRPGPGRFRIEEVEAGSYTLHALFNPERGRDSRPREVGRIDVVVDKGDLDNITLRTARVSAVFGVVTFDGAPPDIGAAAMRVRLSGETASVREDGTFELATAVEAVTIALESPPPGWVVKSVQYRGRDVTDQLVEVETSDDPRAIEITLTNRVGYISGRMAVAPPKGRTILVLAFSAARGRTAGRGADIGVSPAATVFLDAKNMFKLGPLLAGEYLVVAVDRDDWFDASTQNRASAIDSILARAERVLVLEGEQPAITVGIVPIR
jgi:protocatechuate 3,4-dioxygenase beta subunit